MRRHFLSLAVLSVVALTGCDSGPKFTDDREELEYLAALSNPTPEQFKKRKELARTVVVDELKKEYERSIPRFKEIEKNAGPGYVVSYLFRFMGKVP